MSARPRVRVCHIDNLEVASRMWEKGTSWYTQSQAPRVTTCKKKTFTKRERSKVRRNLIKHTTRTIIYVTNTRASLLSGVKVTRSVNIFGPITSCKLSWLDYSCDFTMIGRVFVGQTNARSRTVIVIFGYPPSRVNNRRPVCLAGRPRSGCATATSLLFPHSAPTSRSFSFSPPILCDAKIA